MEKILDFQYDKRKLKNGLEVILHKNSSLPLVAVNIWYKVGSANESPDKTGFAHLFEHMMFQGSEHVAKEEHFKFIQEAGGTLNASTSFDRTNYFETLPSNSLELALWLESDRMGFFLPALTEEKFLNQKEVVMNERRERYDNQPYGRAWEILFSNLYPKNHPYSWPTIGWMEHIENFQLEEVKEFFKKFYAPNNATLTICGDIEIEETFELVQKYFEEIPAGAPVPEIKTEHFTLSESSSIVHYDKVQLPRVYVAIPSVKAYSDDETDLNLLGDLIAGSKSSRLNKELVFKRQIAQEIFAFQYSGKYGGAFVIVGTAKHGIPAEELSFEIHNELKKIVASEVKEDELLRIRNSVKSTFIYSLQNIATLADYFNHYNFYLNEPNYFGKAIKRLNAVTVDSLKATAEKYLTRNFMELRILQEGEQ